MALAAGCAERFRGAYGLDGSGELRRCESPAEGSVRHSIASSGTTGGVVSLDLSGSSDPDGDALSYSCWEYADADTVQSEVPIVSDGGGKFHFTVPDEQDKQI